MTQVTEDSIAETSTSTSTGDMVLAGAIAGHRTYSSKAADTNLVPYRIEAVDSNGNATGDWETGIGTYNSTANSITRTKVEASSNANALVNFAAGTKRISLVLLSSQMYKIDGTPFRQLESLSAGFDPQYFWGFLTSAEGWTSSNANGTVAYDSTNGKGLLITDTSSTGTFALRSPSGLAIDGSKYRRIKAGITYVNLGGGIGAAQPNMQFSTAGHGFGATHRKVISWPPNLQAGDTLILDWDMETAEGEPDWVTSVITQLSIGLTDITPTGNIIRFNWLAVGANRPPQGSDKRMRMMALR